MSKYSADELMTVYSCASYRQGVIKEIQIVIATIEYYSEDKTASFYAKTVRGAGVIVNSPAVNVFTSKEAAIRQAISNNNYVLEQAKKQIAKCQASDKRLAALLEKEINR